MKRREAAACPAASNGLVFGGMSRPAQRCKSLKQAVFDEHEKARREWRAFFQQPVSSNKNTYRQNAPMCILGITWR